MPDSSWSAGCELIFQVDLQAHVQGLMVVKCVIATDGYLYNCRLLKSLPFMDEAVLEALATRRYQPVTYRGKPVTCDYVFNIMLVMPGAPPAQRR